MSAPVLPEGGRLLHIGPHKTGSTTLQAAFHQNRPALVEQGVHYAGRNAQPMTAAMVAAMDRTLPVGAADATNAWDRLVAEVDAATEPRTMISSEFFCEASPERIRMILDRLDPDRTRVVITLRPLVRILASQWQQYMQNKMITDYVAWLHKMFDEPEQTAITPSFWRRHRHDALVRRWSEAAGPDRVTVVAVDETDKLMLVRTFEEMLALTDGTLRPRNVTANRSLTFPEVELVRGFNAAYRRQGWSDGDYTKLVRFGAVRHLQERDPAPGEPRVLTPRWAVERAAEVQQEMVEVIAASGVQVLGRLESLTVGLDEAAIGENEPVTEVPADIAARFAAGLVKHLAEVPAKPPAPDRRIGPLEAAWRLRRESAKVAERLESLRADEG